MSDTYISLDIEADGPTPGQYSMLSLGAVAFDESGLELGYFRANLRRLDGAIQHPETMDWWAKQPEAWKRATENAEPAGDVMRRFRVWAKHYPHPVAVCYPATFDFMFVYWYLIRFCNDSPFSFQALDIKSYASALLSSPFRQTTKKHMPKMWFENLPKHTHDALDDAREQGLLFLNMLAWAKAQKGEDV